MSSPPARVRHTVVPGLLALLLLTCDRSPVRVLLVGDSITAGSVSEPKGPAFAELLATELGPGYEIALAACDGTTSRDWRPEDGGRACGRTVMHPNLYTALVVPALPVNVAVVLLGSNDAHSYREQRPIEIDEYVANLREIARALREGGSRSVMLMTPPPVYHRVKRYRRLMSFRSEIAEICESAEGVECGPNLFDLLEPADFAPQQLHPNATGHARIAAALAEAIRGLGTR